ncbi:hypothetical protein VTL71DRAFT_3473 [Oculimacula yallundae]|uniref:Zn(2)-C6 fungal-type domain-containing protein n=1 Tax=Oculimacula yallundae TaxID=86028 RepID=A0ABR4C7A5_9HELO
MQSVIRPEDQRRRHGDGDGIVITDFYQESTFSHSSSPLEYYHTFLATDNSSNNLEDYIAQSWIPEPLYDLSWNDLPDLQAPWETTSPSTQTNFSSNYGQPFGYPTSLPDSGSPESQSYDHALVTKIACGPGPEYQPYAEAGVEFIQEYRHDYVSQTPQISTSNSSYPEGHAEFMSSVLPSNASVHSDISIYSPISNQQFSTATWVPCTQDSGQQPSYSAPRAPKSEKTITPSAGLSLVWSTNEPKASAPPKLKKLTIPSAAKRKYTFLRPATEEAQLDRHLEECVGVFENAPGALATVKKRKKLEAPVRKAARDVRKAGACHQCRFRKRTCSVGTPCGSCMKNGKGLHEIKCQRESPFMGRPVHEYFEYSSTRRVISFDIRIAPEAFLGDEEYFVLVDGVDRLSHPIKLRARRKLLSSFSASEQVTIRRTREKRNLGKCTDDDLAHVMILEEDETLGTRVEQWAVEYASKFVHTAGTKFQSTTIAMILATAYVKKGLPESTLVASMLRVASMAFVLRAGVKSTPSTPQSPCSQFRTTEATIDTILYQRLQLAINDLFQKLQNIVFRKAGFLTREQVYPIALVFWQLLRILCIGAGHLSNIVMRFNNTTARTQSDAQYLSLKLVLSTHLALFRSSNPLLLDFSDKRNHDLVGGDEELVELAGKMSDMVLGFREKGAPELRGSLAFRKDYFDLFRSVYDGL